jgi:N-acetylglucosamine kinase-like BadF-type ATPase
VDPHRVEAGVMGIAGGRRLADPLVAAVFERAWRDTGLRCPMRVVGDVLVAFRAGTTQPSGTLLIAGTGAIAAQIEDGGMVRTVDGLGWLLGDDGSGFWLGREAVREVARDLYAGRPPGLLARLVADRVLGPDRPAGRPRALAEALVTTVYQRPPVELATLAPLVSHAALAGDDTARTIADTATARLLATLAEIRVDSARTPIVLSGSVLTSPGPIQDAVRRAAADRWDAPVLLAAAGAAGAAWLALRAVTPLVREEEAGALHDRLRAAVPT